MTQKVDDVVAAAGEHVWAVLDARNPEEVQQLALKATAAVLREVADGLCCGGELRELADKVEASDG